ncbi:hypothetical protein [Antarctobacter sp.]|uniref:hypothetical protein n=1 Tax=Antarctobacter sp. TaxID=1872577 RepID=UPI002B266770|nr:hypothetical protein [Antarctobacter sp.]
MADELSDFRRSYEQSSTFLGKRLPRFIVLVIVAFLSLAYGFDHFSAPATDKELGLDPTTVAELGEEEYSFYRRMPESMRDRVDRLPVDERKWFVGSWGRAETRRCPHGSDRITDMGPHQGFRTCVSKEMKELRGWALDQFLN